MTTSVGSLRDVPESWPVRSSTDLHRDDWVIALRADEVSHGGETFSRYVLEHPGAVIVLAVDESERVLCLRQYRHPAQRRFVELPAGLLDSPGESPLAAAMRELREEAGLEATEWIPLSSLWSSPGITSEVTHLFLARGLREADREGFVLAHEEADMTTEWVPYDKLLAAVLDGRVGDAPLVSGVLLARAKGLV